MKWAVVVPSNRDTSEFEKAWNFDNLIIVRDEPPWEGIPDFSPRRTDMIRSWGFYQAWKSGADYILSLDDDCFPTDGDGRTLPLIYEHAFNRGWPCVDCLSVGSLTTSREEMRGFPYPGRNRECVVQYGGWDGVLDYDAVSSLRGQRDAQFSEILMPVPKGVAVTTCAMNFAFKAEYTPIMWQLPLFQGRYNRWGDIWSGLLQKKVLDHLGKVMLINGQAKVRHERASNPDMAFRREAPGFQHEVWETLSTPEGDGDLIETYRYVVADFLWGFEQDNPEYANHFRRCLDQWLELFS